MDFKKVFEKEITFENASDIIIHKNRAYTNTVTGVSSARLDNVLRPGKRYIFSPRLYKGTKGTAPQGMYIWFDKEDNCLFVLCAVLDENDRWRETARAMFYWDDGLQYMGKLCLESKFDICGQSREGGAILDGESWKQSLMFFGGFVGLLRVIGGDNKVINMFNMSGIESFKSVMYCLDNTEAGEAFNWYHARLVINAVNSDGDIVSKNENDFPPLPQKAEYNLRRYFEECEKQRRQEGYIAWLCPKAVCIQKVGNEVYRRRYTYAAFAGQQLEETEIIIMEIERDKLKPLNTDKISEREKNANIFMPVWVDDLSGTFFEYTSGLLYGWIKTLEEAMDKSGHFEEFSEAAKQVFSQDEQILNPALTLYIAEVFATSPMLERLYNMEIPGCDWIKQQIVVSLNYNIGHQSILDRLGKVCNPEKKTVHGQLGIPSALLYACIRENDISPVSVAKEIFSETAEERCYLERMNKESCEAFIEQAREAKDNGFMASWKDCMEKLVSMYGFKNWLAYSTFINSMDEDDVWAYEEYVDTLLAIGTEAKTREWKVTPDKIAETKRILSEAYKLTIDCRYQADYDFKMRKFFGEWAGFCYEDKEFFVTYPRSSKEIVEEGLCLRHCASNFINECTRGNTCLLFVRKKEDPSKPFYTLEIRDGAIRQCHGFANRDIGAIEGLEAFLRKFCEDKGVEFRDGRELLGP